MRKLTVGLVLLILNASLFAQTPNTLESPPAWQEGFEGLTVGVLPGQAGWFSPLADPAAVASLVSAAQARTGSQSMEVRPYTSTAVSIPLLSAGSMRLKMSLYIPSSFTGYGRVSLIDTQGNLAFDLTLDGYGNQFWGTAGLHPMTRDMWLDLVWDVGRDANRMITYVDGIAIWDQPYSWGSPGLDPVNEIQVSGVETLFWMDEFALHAIESAVLQLNTEGAFASCDAVIADVFGGTGTAAVSPGETVGFRVLSDFDPQTVLLGVNAAPLVPSGAGGTLTGGGQHVNLDVAVPIEIIPVLLGPAGLATDVASPVIGTTTCQVGVPDPTHPDGMLLTQACTLDVRLPCVTVEARGADNGVYDPQAAFWKVTHHGGCAKIVDVQIDWRASNDPVKKDRYFDTDFDFGGGVAFINGNSPVCAGTFRNCSAVCTGLDFSELNQFDPHWSSAWVPCDPGAYCGWSAYGWVTSNLLGNTDWKALRFRFADFESETFEFDVKTAGVPGSSGADMAGLWVQVELEDGTFMDGHLKLDPDDPTRAYVDLHN